MTKAQYIGDTGDFHSAIRTVVVKWPDSWAARDTWIPGTGTARPAVTVTGGSTYPGGVGGNPPWRIGDFPPTSPWEWPNTEPWAPGPWKPTPWVPQTPPPLPPTQSGWLCPRCQASNAPSVKRCSCSPPACKKKQQERR